MKMIRFKSCKKCPMLLQIKNFDFCKIEAKEIPDIDIIADFCKQEDYPKTIKEFVQDKNMNNILEQIQQIKKKIHH